MAHHVRRICLDMEYMHIPQGSVIASRTDRFRTNVGLQRNGRVIVRKACISDVREILELLNGFTKSHAILPRGPQYIFENIRDFFVATERPDDGGNRETCEDEVLPIVACGSLHIIWEDLAEVRSMVTHQEFQGRGIGKRLIDDMKREAKSLGIKKLFVFTMAEGFFRALGFEPKRREDLPEKLWGECSWCPKYFKCNEVGMLLKI